jgi:hypothetical protein
MVYTECAVYFLRPPAGAQGFLPEEVGGFVSTFMCEKHPALAALAKAVANAGRPRRSATQFSLCQHFRDSLGATRIFFLESFF